MDKEEASQRAYIDFIPMKERFYTNTPVAFGNTSERELFDQITSYIREKGWTGAQKGFEEKFSYSDYLL